MTTPQTPLPSGLGATTTAAEIVAGLDLSGRMAIVTGGYSGLGRETARVLRAAGAEVIVSARDLDRAQAALTGIDVRIEAMDLLDPVSIDAFAKRFLATGRSLHVLINCAAVMACPLARDGRGHEMQFSTNHLGHFQLTSRLWPALAEAGGARVVAVSSRGHRFSPVMFDDPDFLRRDYDPWLGYGQSKTANALFAVELDRRGAAHGVRAFSVHPGGIVETGLSKHVDPALLIAHGAIDALGRAVIDPARNLKTVEQGAATIVWCAVSPQLDGKGGVYCENCDVSSLAPDGNAAIRQPAELMHLGGVLPYAVDPQAARRLWELSENMLGMTAEPNG